MRREGESNKVTSTTGTLNCEWIAKNCIICTMGTRNRKMHEMRRKACVNKSRV
jgi:hypothetical protein